ncbi:MBL fold metallo-hydrolase [Streptomyces spongiae]|uniref:MBL fold metallo-hydrolase n=1 Tax=Streptomyces spongiae TaxID=565072 RepID=A0A5N8XAN5_9ACTN|nr:MBL fold metallo-hydrolase [Streptomyces spongiae]MPY56543.1 MBL fold metallo-hydrolase [Streptomyces spongiae]
MSDGGASQHALHRVGAEAMRQPTDAGRGTELVLLGTAGGPPPVRGRQGIASALVVGGRTYLIDCGRGVVSQFVRAGLDMSTLAGVFITHLHSDHVCHYFDIPLLVAGASDEDAPRPIDVYGPASAGSLRTPPILAPDEPMPGIAGLTEKCNAAFAYSTNVFASEGLGVKNPAEYVRVHELMPPAGTGASALGDTAPAMEPFQVMEDDSLRVTAILVPHGPVFPSFAYRFETEHGSVVFSGDTALTPNIPTLAEGADLLVHEAVDMDWLADQGVTGETLEHMRAVHTDIDAIGRIGAESGVRRIVLSHLVPGDVVDYPQERWQRRADASRKAGRYEGDIIAGADLQRFRVPR